MATELRDRLQATLGQAHTLERELGGGGMSRVFVAHEHALGRRVVVKVLPPELAAGVNVERFKREIAFAAQLQHPHIVPVLSAGETDGLPYYVMPLVDGESLRARLARTGPLPIVEAVHILGDVAKALAHAHARGVVHRDIKPDNVLLSGGAAVVTDFGVAKALSSAMAVGSRESHGTMLTGVGMTTGTPTYMAPEQAAADPDADHRIDIYAFGVMAYEMLCGRPPFTGKSLQALLAAHLGELPVPIDEMRDDVPYGLASLVMACLEKEAAHRPQSAQEVVERLDGTAVGSEPATTGVFAAPATPARGIAAFVLAGGAVALLAKAAEVALALPGWVFTGTLIVLALGFPPLLLAALLSRRRTSASPALTPGGSRYTPATTGTRAKAPWLSWPRASGLAATLVLAWAALVGSIVALGALGLGPARSLLAAGVIEERASILIADFTATGPDTVLGSVVTEAFRTDLAQSSVVSVVSASTIRSGLARMQRPVGTRLDPTLARDLAVRDGIPAVVTGEITAIGGGYVLTARLIAPDSGDVLASVRETAADQSELLPALDRLSKGLRERIGESLREVRRKPPLAQVTTPSIEALRKYAMAVRLIDGEGDYERGMALLEEAIAIDTAFAMAYRKLAITYNNTNRQFERARDLLTKAWEHRDRLTPLERHLTEGTYFGSGPGFDREQAIAAYEAALAIDPKNSTALNNLAGQYNAKGDLERAEELWRRAVSAEPGGASAHFNLVSVQVALGKPDSAYAAYELARSRFPRHRLAHMGSAMVAYSRFGPDSARAAFRRVRESEDAPAEIRLAALLALASFTFLEGRFAEGERMLREAWAENAARGEPRIPLTEEASLAFLDVWYRDDAGAALRQLDDAVRRYPIESYTLIRRPYLNLAMSYAAAGRPDRARTYLARYDAELTDTAFRRMQEPSLHRVLAEVALAEDRPLDALAEMRLATSVNACRHCNDAELARAFDAAAMPDSAIAAFERYLAERSPARIDFDPTYLPGTYKRLGELYESRGDTVRAHAMYERLIALWKDGDPDARARVEEVRRRMMGQGEG